MKDDPYRICRSYQEHGACFCSEGVIPGCVAQASGAYLDLIARVLGALKPDGS